MTTFSTQRKDPGVAKAEERLGEILTCLGKNRIPELEVGDFYEDLVKEPKSQGRLEAFEEQIGIRLGLRILDQVMLEQFTRIEDLVAIENDLKEEVRLVTEEKVKADRQNKRMRTEIGVLQKRIQEKKSDSPTLTNEHKTQELELTSLKTENQKLKSKLGILVKQYEQLASELRGTPPSNTSEHLPQSHELPVPKKTNSRKRKSPSPEDHLSKTPVKSGKSRVFSRKLSSNEALIHSNSTQAHIDDISFVPQTETLMVGESPGISKPTPLPSIKHSVPDTPEKSKADSGSFKNYKHLVTPEKVQKQMKEVKVEPKTEKLPNSPVISRNLSRVGGGKKLRLIIREKGEGVNNPLAVPLRDRQESVKNSMKYCDQDDEKVRVGKVRPSVQSEIDKKSFQELDIDFPVPKRIKKGPENARKVAVPVALPSDTDSDFESPNLLVKRSRRRDAEIPMERDEPPEFKTPIIMEKVTPMERTESVDDIEIFASPDDKPSAPKNGTKKSKSVKQSIKVINNWGIDITEMTKSQEKNFNKGKQSKIDGFFKNPPIRQNSDFIRINHADTDMERALKLSREADEEKGKETENMNSSPFKHEYDELDKEQVKPNFAHVGEAVRTKEARKQLYGFDCRECEEYYHMKLEEGLTKDQIMKVLNKCSKHRGYFKPPLTPEKFWDADIVEGDPDSPRNKTQAGVPFRNRAKRRAEAREKRKALKNLDNE